MTVPFVFKIDSQTRSGSLIPGRCFSMYYGSRMNTGRMGIRPYLFSVNYVTMWFAFRSLNGLARHGSTRFVVISTARSPFAADKRPLLHFKCSSLCSLWLCGLLFGRCAARHNIPFLDRCSVVSSRHSLYFHTTASDISFPQ